MCVQCFLLIICGYWLLFCINLLCRLNVGWCIHMLKFEVCFLNSRLVCECNQIYSDASVYILKEQSSYFRVQTWFECACTLQSECPSYMWKRPCMHTHVFPFSSPKTSRPAWPCTATHTQSRLLYKDSLFVTHIVVQCTKCSEMYLLPFPWGSSGQLSVLLKATPGMGDGLVVWLGFNPTSFCIPV